MSGDKLDPFIERSETLEKMGAERPGVLVNQKPDDINLLEVFGAAVNLEEEK